ALARNGRECRVRGAHRRRRDRRRREKWRDARNEGGGDRNPSGWTPRAAPCSLLSGVPMLGDGRPPPSPGLQPWDSPDSSTRTGLQGPLVILAATHHGTSARSQRVASASGSGVCEEGGGARAQGQGRGRRVER